MSSSAKTSSSHENNTAGGTAAVCAICCDDSKTNLISLTGCSHTSCADCLIQWIEKVESTGQVTLPGCPFCRLELTSEETNQILGRPFQPARASGGTGAANPEIELDDLTRQWLNEQTKQCPRCGAYIEKIRGGCDMMECLCGYRFCYNCGAAGARCSCTPETHSFWDNILDRNAGSSPQREAPLSQENGVVDLMTHIEQRKKQDRDDQIRKQRATRRMQKARECRYIDEITYSARWLFLPTTRKATYKMLEQLRAQSRIQSKRQQFRFNLERDEREVDELVTSARWLFLPPQGAYQVLEQLKENSIYNRRQRFRPLRVQEEAFLKPLDYSARWLFCNTQTGFRMLRQQRQADRIYQRRVWKINHLVGDRNEEEQPDRFVTSGSWLYKKKTASATKDQMKRLFRHQSKANRARTYRQLGLDFARFSYFDPFSAASNDPKAQEEEDMRENALNIRILYLSDQERIMERKEIARYGL